MNEKNTRKEKLQFFLFWSWNLIFIAFMLLGFAPRLLPELMTAVKTGVIPLNFLILAMVLSSVPVAAVVLGLTRLRNQPGRLFAVGYVVEGPLMLLLAVRFFLIRQATPALNFVMLVALLGMGAFLWYTLDDKIEKRPRWVGVVRLLGLTMILLTSLYAAILVSFYAVPLLSIFIQWLVETVAHPIEFLTGFFDGLWRMIRDGITWLPVIVLGFILAMYTATLFVITPLAVPYLSVRAWLQELRKQVNRSGWAVPGASVLLLLVLTAVLFIVANQQPQKAVFAMLEQPPASMQAASELLAQTDKIREGLVNAYLAPFRYISARGEVRHIRMLYMDIFDIQERQAYRVQQLYETMAQPLLYQPVHPQSYPFVRDNLAFQREPDEAAQLYQAVFDEPINEGERQYIVDAVRSTWSSRDAEAAWQVVGDREVMLSQQEIKVQEYGDWAQIELYEVYQNQTGDRQEVVYYFNLPESAVITGLWLGDSADRSERYEFHVAPRGAAQQTYREQVRRNVDPALLEQIGPRQYRLRAFPILPVAMHWDDERNRQLVEEAPEFHLWLTYAAMAGENGWPLPQLADSRNVYWDRNTRRLVNGERMQVDMDAWLPESVAVVEASPAQAHRVDFSNGESVLAWPVSQIAPVQLPTGLRLAVVVDRSYSMMAHQEAVSVALARLEELANEGASINLYLTSSEFRGEPPSRIGISSFDRDDLYFLGGQNPGELLAQFVDLDQGDIYDAILVVSDGDSYEQGISYTKLPVFAAPIWMIHLGEDIPLGYDDATLEAIQASGGGVVGGLEEAFERLAFNLSPTFKDGGYHKLLDGYIWSVISSETAGETDAVLHPAQEGFAVMAARQLILAETQRASGSLDQLEQLDALHALAKEYGIVTPYSSMIVLVDRFQEARLETLESGIDRFEREYETVGETLPENQMPLSGVPEPEEWLLIGLAVAMLIWYMNRGGLWGRLSFSFIRKGKR